MHILFYDRKHEGITNSKNEIKYMYKNNYACIKIKIQMKKIDARQIWIYSNRNKIETVFILDYKCIFSSSSSS